MYAIFIILLLLPGVLFILWGIHCIIQYIREIAGSIRLCNLPHKIESGFLGIDKVNYKTHYADSYTIDSNGNMYTHIGGGGEIHIPQSYTLKLYPGGDKAFYNQPLILHSLPGETDILKIQFGYGWIDYVTDAGGKNYFISFTPDKNDRL